MSLVTNTYNKILEGIQYLKGVAESTENFIDTVTTIVSRTYNFLEPIFSFLPWEVILLLIATVFLLSWVNGIFPTTPKLNYTIVVLFLCWAWGYSEAIAAEDGVVSYGRIFRAMTYLLLPVHFLGLVGLSWKYGYRYYSKRNKIHAKTMEDFLLKFSRVSHEIQSIGHGIIIGESKDEKFKEKLEEMKKLISSINEK
ncbi:MAG: hypothetical protein JJT78_09410 [Leptospira sp.]|nr:hypothetical protein [Leptospira sp.]